MRSKLGARKAQRQQRVDDHRREVATELTAKALLDLKCLRHRHLRPQRHRQIGRARRALEQLPHLARLPGNRADAGDRAEGLRRAEHAQRMPGRGRVEHDQIMAAAGSPALAAGQLPDLDHRHQLLRAGRRGREVLERAARGEHPP